MKNLLIGTYKFRAKSASRYKEDAPETWGHAFHIPGEETDKKDGDGNPIIWINCYIENESWHKSIKPGQQFVVIKQKKTGKDATGYSYRVIEPSEEVKQFFGAVKQSPQKPAQASVQPTINNAIDAARAYKAIRWMLNADVNNKIPFEHMAQLFLNLDAIDVNRKEWLLAAFMDIEQMTIHYGKIIKALQGN